MFSGSSPESWPSDFACGAILTDSEPVELNNPANGAAMPPNASQGEPASRSDRRLRASLVEIGVGLLPPSMNTSPARPAAPGLPPKSQVAYALVIVPPSE